MHLLSQISSLIHLWKCFSLIVVVLFKQAEPTQKFMFGQHFPCLIEGWEKKGQVWTGHKEYSGTLLLQSKVSMPWKHPMGTHSLELETGGAQATEGFIVITAFS